VDDVFAGVQWFHVTGITPALGASVADATARRLRPPRHGARVSLDLNYGEALGTIERER